MTDELLVVDPNGLINVAFRWLPHGEPLALSCT